MVKNTSGDRRMVRDPTPEQIRLRAEAIRRGWTDRERSRRSSWNPPAWLPPVLSLPDIVSMIPTDESNV